MKKLKKESKLGTKPWAKLRMTRREYEMKRPWAFVVSGKKMSRAKFEQCLLLLDQEDIDAAVEEGQAEMLLKEIFK